MPIENWFKLQDGKFEALYKIRLFKRIPAFFREIEYDMNFQFERINLEKILKLRDIVMMESLAARNNDKVKKFHAESMKKELINDLKKNDKGEKMTMNTMFNYIETTLNCFGTLHGKMNTSRVFSLYNLASDRNKELEKHHKRAS